MQKGNWQDPLLKQVLPIAAELTSPFGFSTDPVGDLTAMNETGLIHKYYGRVLFINTATCAIHCRYCFRRHFPYQHHQLSRQHYQQSLQYLRDHPEIQEVIFSGGDPLLLSDDKLIELIKELNQLPQMIRLRIHTRLPIVLPDRITEELIKALQHFNHSVIMVVHCNHPNELSVSVKQACQRISQAGIHLLNQTVLLKGINDSVDILSTLSEQLLISKILPYYCHLLDKAIGTAHFEVEKSIAIELMQQLHHRLPGYLVPKLVWEQAGAAAKTVLL
jgi:EF-P beta-lysylation protein EpmB